MADWIFTRFSDPPKNARVWVACVDGGLDVRAAKWNGDQFVFSGGHVYGVYAYMIRTSSLKKPKAPANKGWFKAGE